MAVASAFRPFPTAMSGNMCSFPRYGLMDRLADPGYLAVRYMRKYREREDLGRRLFGGRQPPSREAQVRGLPMARDRIVDAGLHPHRADPPPPPPPPPDPSPP